MCFTQLIYRIPYPEEAPDHSVTVGSVNTALVLTDWLDAYMVPDEYRDYWESSGADVKFIADIPAGRFTLNRGVAGSYEDGDGRRHIVIEPPWFNKGVLAHEQAHHSFGLLDNEQKAAWSLACSATKMKHPVKTLFSKKPYGLTNNVEAHADIYRYLGPKMPKNLMQFYPKLA